MTFYTYDNTPEGFFTVVFDIYTQKKLPSAISGDKIFQLGLETELFQIETDMEKASRIEKSLKNHIGQKGLQDIYYALNSCEEKKEMMIFNYIRLIFREGKKALEMLSNPIVIEFNLLVSKVTYEIHRLKGFLRFKELSNGVFYGELSPDNNIIKYLTPYFTSRDSEINFIIHDTKRNIMSLCNGTEIKTVSCQQKIPEIFSQQEIFYQQLWQQYFNTVSIASRKNERLQKNFMPLRYRKNMSEFQQM